MLLNEIMNNDPTIFVDRLISVARHKKAPRALAQSLRRKADRQGSELDTPDGRSKFIDTHGQVTWERNKQNKTPLNMGPKVRVRESARPDSYVTTIPVEQICRPEGTMKDPHIDKLHADFRNGAKFPPVDVMKLSDHNRSVLGCGPETIYVLVDGHHRLSVYDREGIASTKARVWESDPGEWLD